MMMIIGDDDDDDDDETDVNDVSTRKQATRKSILRETNVKQEISKITL